MKLNKFIKKYLNIKRWSLSKIVSSLKNIINLKLRLVHVAPFFLFTILITSFIIYLCSGLTSDLKVKAATQESKVKISSLNSEINDYKKELKNIVEIRDRYRNSIKEIVDMLYHKDVAMGGSGEMLNSSDEVTLLHLRTIVNSMDDDVGLLEEAKTYLLARKEFADNFPFVWPIKLEGQPNINSSFGIRSNKETGDTPLNNYHYHSGIDLSGKFGDPIVATADGRIVYTSNSHPEYGYLVIIQHKYEFSTYYGHMSKINVYMGQNVKRGDVIGEMGNTGKSTGVHLHYEIRTSGTPIDPMTFLAVDY